MSDGRDRSRLLAAAGVVFALLMAGLYVAMLQEDDAPPPAVVTKAAPVEAPPPRPEPTHLIEDPTPAAEDAPREAETEPTPVEVVLEPETPTQELASLAGTVVDTKGTPVPRARVIIEAGPRKMRVRSDDDGDWTAPFVPAGTTVVYAERRDGALSVMSDREVLETQDGRDYEIELVLPAEKTGGLGINLRPHREGAKIGSLIPDGQGEYIGLQTGDVILEVDDESIYGMSLADIAKLIKGPEGSTGTLKVRRARTEVEEVVAFEREFVDKVRRRPR